MRNYSLTKYILLPLLLCISFLAHADSTYSKVFIFGDSLSDTGNLASVVGGIPLPYYQNRISNGPVAVDLLTAKLGDTAEASLHLLGLNAGHNYSVAGAKASGNEVIDLDTQILSFQANHASIAPADALYVVFLGGNDIRAALHQPDPVVAESILETAKNKTRAAIEILSQMGARSFLVINSPNIALVPETQLIATAINNPDLVIHADALSKHYNKKLHDMVEIFEKNENISITEFNLFKMFNKVVRKASKLGFTNYTDACFSSITFTFHPDCNYGFNVDQFVFFDEIHPTARVHAMFGEAFYKALNDDNDNDDEEEEKED